MKAQQIEFTLEEQQQALELQEALEFLSDAPELQELWLMQDLDGFFDN